MRVSKTAAPLTNEQKQQTERLVKEANEQVEEGKRVSDRLLNARVLYRERLTGVVEDK